MERSICDGLAEVVTRVFYKEFTVADSLPRRVAEESMKFLKEVPVATLVSELGYIWARFAPPEDPKVLGVDWIGCIVGTSEK